MKIKHLLLLLLLAFGASWTANGQDTIFSNLLTVNDGPNRSSSVPIRGELVQYGTNGQIIFPQSELTAMRGGTVNKLTLYSTSQNENWDPAIFSIYMAEVAYDEFANPEFVDWNSMSKVFTGRLAINNYMMEIVLDSAFTYYGSNLMIGFEEDEKGTNSGYVFWYGLLQSNKYPAVISYCSPYTTYTVKRHNFLPKMTFEYYVLDFPRVEVIEEDITPFSASFSWEMPSSEVTGYKYQYNKASEGFTDNWVELPSTATALTLEGLDPVTEYFFRIKACYGEQESDMTVVDFTTLCPGYATIPYYENFDSYVVSNSLMPLERTIPDCWDYINTSTNPADNVYPSIHSSLISNHYPYANSSPNDVHFYIDNRSSVYEAKPQYLILPAMQNINGLRLKFSARSYNSTTPLFSSKFKVGVMEETESGPVFISIKEFEPNTIHQLYTVDFNRYQGNGERIAIWMEVPNRNYGRVFIDDIEVEALPMFTMPISSHEGMWDGWYMISCPLAGETNPEDVTHLINNGFDLYRFNQNPDNPGMVWENWKQVGDHYHFNLEPGRGYLYASADSVNLSFVGTPYSGDGNVVLHYDEDEQFGGWNLVGNPFTAPAYIGDRSYYRMNDMGTDYVPAVTGSSIGVMEGIFVYTEVDGEELTFSTMQPNRNNEQLSVNVSKITRSGLSTTIDRAILLFGEGDALPKFKLNEESAKVYIPQNGRNYAVVTTEGQGEMPVNFSADENGTYTLSFNCDNVEFSYLHLFDNKTGIDTDLLSTPSYTFNATTMDYESRFKLVFATGSSVDGDSFSFINSNGNFCIFGIEGQATLQVLDVMGRLLSTETFSGSIEKQLNVAPGVYFIRLINGDDVKTQKIVVR